MNRRKFLTSISAGGIIALSGCTTINSESDNNLENISIEIINSQSSTNDVQLLVESKTDHIHWSNYSIQGNESEIIDIEIPEDKQFKELFVQYDDEIYTADFKQWDDLDCGSVRFQIVDDEDRTTDLYYSTRGIGGCE